MKNDFSSRKSGWLSFTFAICILFVMSLSSGFSYLGACLIRSIISVNILLRSQHYLAGKLSSFHNPWRT